MTLTSKEERVWFCLSVLFCGVHVCLTFFKGFFFKRSKILHPNFFSVSGIHPDEVTSPGLSPCLLPRLQKLRAEELVCFTGHRGDSEARAAPAAAGLLSYVHLPIA